MATRRRSSNKTITGTITDLQRRVRYLQANTPASRLANQVVARANVRPRAIDSDQIALQAITNDQVAFDAIKQANLDSNSVGENELIDGSVKEAKIDANAVTNSKIQDLAVSTTKLANASVTEQKITTSAVTQDKIRDGAVARSKIQNSAVGTNQLDNSSVTTGKLSDSSVSTGKLADSSVTSAKIGGGAVGTSKLADGSVINQKIADLAVSGGKIANGTITGNKIADGAITAIKIATGGVNLGNISEATRTLIVRNGISAGEGISLSNTSTGVSIRVNFGSAGGQAPRGTHYHSYSDANGLSSSTKNTSASINPSSSRVKKDISDYNLEDPEKILKLTLKKYKYKNSRRGIQDYLRREWMYGYIAEEVLSLGLEEIVGYDEEGLPASLDYGLLSVFIIELLKKHNEEIQLLKNQINKEN